MTTVLVTRPLHQAEGFCQLLEGQGFSVERLPLIEIIPITLTDSALRVLSRKSGFDWVIFVSANAVNFALTGKNGKIYQQCQVSKVAAVGQATAKALQTAGVRVRLMPEQGFNSEALLAMPELQNVQGQQCLIVRGEGGRELLAEALRERGAEVAYLEVYKRKPPAADPDKMIGLLRGKSVDIITVTSAEALQNLLLQLQSNPLKELLLNIPLVVISDRLGLIAKTLGFKSIAVSEGVSDAAVLKTIINLVSGEDSG